MKIIFLDIDGVLNCDKTPNPRKFPYIVDRKLLARLKKLLERTGAKVVLSSSWRCDPVGLFAVLTRGDAGTYNAVDLYARPWPFVAIAREKLAAEDDLFRDDVDISTPYVAAGPNAPYLETAPSLPGLALLGAGLTPGYLGTRGPTNAEGA